MSAIDENTDDPRMIFGSFFSVNIITKNFFKKNTNQNFLRKSYSQKEMIPAGKNKEGNTKQKTKNKKNINSRSITL